MWLRGGASSCAQGGACVQPSPCCPQGVKLLSHLYQEALDNCSNEHYPVLLSLLKTSCEPYTRWGPACGRGCWGRARHRTRSGQIGEHLLGQTPAVEGKAGLVGSLGRAPHPVAATPARLTTGPSIRQVHPRLGVQRSLQRRLRRVHDPSEPRVPGLQR